MQENKIIFSLVGINKFFPPKKQVLKDIYLSFFYGAKIGIIGLNGSGKSTLLKIIAGIEKNFDGEIHFAKDYSIGILEQEPILDDSKTVKEIIEEGISDIIDVLREYENVNNRFGDDLNDEEMDMLIKRQGELTEIIEQKNGWTIDSVMQRAMDALNVPDANTQVSILSGGEKRRVALCRLLISEPDILLLDEPTNHLDAESILWLEEHLNQYKGTVIAITHDRYFLDNIAGWILELDRGEGIPWKGNYSSWLNQKLNRLTLEQKQESKHIKTIAREFEWVKMSPRARQSKSKARLNSYNELLNADLKQKEENLEIFIPNGPRLGNKVIISNNVKKTYENKILFDNLNFILPPAGIVGVIGPNGCGKTTLLKLILGLEKPDSGYFEIGDSVKLGYFDQSHSKINTENSIWQVISDNNEYISLDGKQFKSRAYVGKFNFTGQDQEKLVKNLSGGEKNRLHLAMTLKSEANVLLLDEPTNDIDVNTLRALEEGLLNFAGCAVVITHDRWFLDRVATHILAFEGNSEVFFFEGSFSDYELNRKLRNPASLPAKFKYKKLKE
jgi:energy-dependent translational throttle protein EttA